jgi:hypothetical protein
MLKKPEFYADLPSAVQSALRTGHTGSLRTLARLRDSRLLELIADLIDERQQILIHHLTPTELGGACGLCGAREGERHQDLG